VAWCNAYVAGLNNQEVAGLTLRRVTTSIDDCLWTGKPSQYVTNHQGKLSLPSLQGR